jgi:hypothetical protein
MTTRQTWLAMSLLVLTPALAAAQATTSGLAVNGSFPGQDHDVFIDDGTNTEKWFRYDLRGGRSYCVEVGAGRTQSSDSDEGGSGDLTVFASNATTVIVSNSATGQEPDAFQGSRGCFLMTGTVGSQETAYVRVTDGAAGTYTYRMRLVETSLWASWFFIGGDYNAFTLLRNTTTASVSYTMTWRNPAGTVVGTTSGTVPANGGIGINARTFIANPVTNFNGTVEVYHTASPEGLVGQVTSLSSTTGLGFDSTLFQRKTWQ